MTGSWVHKVLLLVGCVSLSMNAACGQTAAAPAYDVVSIKPDKALSCCSVRVSVTNDRFVGTNVSLKVLIAYAYDLKTEEQIAGVTSAINSANWDIEAKVDTGTAAAMKLMSAEENQARRRAMMKAMLADRFALKVHHESKELQRYDLVVAKGGTKLKEADPNDTYANGIQRTNGKAGAGSIDRTRGKLTAQGIPMIDLVKNLSSQLQREVVDRTGLTGKYDFTLVWSDENTVETADAGSLAPSIFTAVQEQLGLRLESTKGPVDTVVVDRVEMPSEN